MKPADICQFVLGSSKLAQILDELTNPQIKTVLKEGNVKVKMPSGFVPQQRRRQLWSARILESVVQQNQTAAAELLQQWLLNHRRPLLVGFLDQLGVSHRNGETDQSFLLSGAVVKIRDAAERLMVDFDRGEAAAYLNYIAYQQRATVFDGWEPLATAGTPPPGATLPTAETPPAAT
ncbi:MAG: hypothetical protein IT371_02545 [Deltaproteobacteria bacterium]|nr:hypothetical protein [Deltaproteobacteria bacterium]